MRLMLVLLAGLAGGLSPAMRTFAQPLPELGDAAGAAIAPQVERRIGESIVREIRASDPFASAGSIGSGMKRPLRRADVRYIRFAGRSYIGFTCSFDRKRE